MTRLLARPIELRMNTDDILRAFYRGEPSGNVTAEDVVRANDVWQVVPVLYHLAMSRRARTIVEIGMADGSTTVPLLCAARELGGIVWSVDPMSPSVSIVALEMFDRLGLLAEHVFANQTSDEFFRLFDRPIDLAFIDGNHEVDYVERDLRNVLNLLVPGGLIVLHDFGSLPADGSIGGWKGVTPNERGSSGVQRAVVLALCGRTDVDVMPLDLAGVPDGARWPGIGCCVIRKRPAGELPMLSCESESELRRRYSSDSV